MGADEEADPKRKFFARDRERREAILKVRRVADSFVDLALAAWDKAKAIREQDPPPSAEILALADRLETVAKQAEQAETKALATATRMLDDVTTNAQEGTYLVRQMEPFESILPIVQAEEAAGRDSDLHPEVARARERVKLIDAEIEALKKAKNGPPSV